MDLKAGKQILVDGHTAVVQSMMSEDGKYFIAWTTGPHVEEGVNPATAWNEAAPVVVTWDASMTKVDWFAPDDPRLSDYPA